MFHEATPFGLRAPLQEAFYQLYTFKLLSMTRGLHGNLHYHRHHSPMKGVVFHQWP
ncbi:hypothetical protein HanIR_Chr16g0795671 [Helianthus annuus]|nr:hypothetical protein HanIR_Chr16g0795671 [Helianthus annuus]